MSSLAVSSLSLHNANKHMYIAKIGTNPFKLTLKVLTFAWNNKYPFNRSGENIPSLLDLGKAQYGGPFTTEEVENVKTFFRMVVLLITLFGYHFSGDGFVKAHYFQKYSCPGDNIFGFVVVNPTCMSGMVVF